MAPQLIYVKQGDRLTVSWPATIEPAGNASGEFSPLLVEAEFIEIDQHDAVMEAVAAAIAPNV